MKDWTDQSLLEQLKSKNEEQVNEALKHLFRQYFGLIKELVVKNSGTVRDAEDIFQDGLIILLKQIQTEDLVLTCSLKTYIYSICRNLWSNELRKKKAGDLKESEDYVLMEKNQLDILIQSEAGDIIADLFEQIGADCKQILTHFYYEKLRMKEIAQRMGLASEQVAKNKKSKCLAHLRKLVLASPFYQKILK